MKKTSVLALATVFLLASVCFAGERNMIRNFDKNGLKDLNNQLKKQEKLIKKLQKQLGQSGASTTTVQSTEDFVSETVLDSAGTVINTVPAVGVAREDGRLELYDTSIDEATVISIEPSSYVHETQAKIAVPSSYFLDLRGIYKTTTTQQYTADILTLRDANGNTLTLQNVDETNNISMAGPIAGGRDQAAVFGDGVWVHIFIIYNPTTGDTSNVGSETATAPTLTGALAGYTFYCRVGAIYVYDAGGGLGNRITLSYQMGDRVTYNTNWIKWDTNNNSYTSIPLTAVVPATAKMVHGSMGLSAGTTAHKMAVASNSGGTIKVGALCDAQGTGHTDYGVSGSKNFTLPLITPQTIWWKTETTDNIYAVGIEGFTDDL